MGDADRKKMRQRVYIYLTCTALTYSVATIMYFMVRMYPELEFFVFLLLLFLLLFFAVRYEMTSNLNSVCFGCYYFVFIVIFST